MPVTRWLVVCVLLSLIGGGIGGAVTTRYVLTSPSKNTSAITSTLANLSGVSTSTVFSLHDEEVQSIDVVRRSSPAVVSIVITKQLSSRSPDDFFNDFLNNRFFSVPSRPAVPGTAASTTQRLRVGGGSGFLVAADGYVVTNRHVVEDKNAEYTVVLQDGREFPGKVLALDPSLDLAVVKIDGTNFPFLPLGDSDQIQIGQTVIAIGNALAEFQNTVTKGVISGVNRRLVAGGGLNTEVIEGALQTDAAINPGNSGGPLIDLQGRVIGMNTAISEDAQSLGFALPINLAKQAVESVKRTGKIIRPWIGVRYIDVDQELADQKHLPHAYGVLVQGGLTKADPAVIPDSPADKAGIKADDVILELNGQVLDSTHPLTTLIARYAPGDQVTVKIWRAGQEQMLTLKLEERK